MKELREKRGRLMGEMKSLNDKAKAESRTFTEDEKKMWSKMVDDLGVLDSDIRIAEEREAIESRVEVTHETVADVRNVSKEEARDKSNRAFRNLILSKYGIRKFTEEDAKWLNGEQRTNAQSTTDNKGGYTIPTGFSNELALAKLFWGGVESVSRVIRTPEGNDLEWPYANDTAVVARQINEATDANTSSTDVTFASKTFKAYKWTSDLILVSFELIEDSAFDIYALLAKLFGERMGRGLNAAFTTGVGTTTIQGVVVGATSGEAALVSSLTYADIVNLMHSVNPAYWANARWMFNATTLGYIRKLEDTDGHLIWQPEMVSAVPATILGKPYVINPDMADIGASAKSVLFGDFQNYIIRYAGQPRMKISTERYFESDQAALVLFERVDGQLLDAGTHPIKYIAHAGS